jgi:putative PIN family toxin of toxin-antitoxin system
MTPLDAVLDTNVLISALRSRRGASFALLSLVGDPRWRLHISTALLLEYEEIGRREAQHLWANPQRVEDILDYLCQASIEHPIDFRWRPLLQDPDDDFILELAVSAQAPYIVTHNLRNFMGVERFNVQAITPAEMLAKIRKVQ